MKNTRLFVFFVAVFMSFGPAIQPASASSKAPPTQISDDMEMLIQNSEFIVLAHVLELRKGMSKTHVKLAVDEVYKGLAEAPQFTLEHDGGKHTVSFDEPSFVSYDKAILFLRKDPKGAWRSVDGARGKKTILNDNVYVEPGDGFASVPFKKYRNELVKKVAQSVGK